MKLHQLFTVFNTRASICIYMCTLYIGAYTNKYNTIYGVCVFKASIRRSASLLKLTFAIHLDGWIKLSLFFVIFFSSVIRYSIN